MTESHLRELFDVAVADAPRGTFDLEDAIRTGRRRRRARACGIALVATVAVAVAGTGAFALTRPTTGTASPTAGPAPRVTVQPATEPTEPALPTQDDLERIARQLAAPSRGHVTVVQVESSTPGGYALRVVRLHVTVPGKGAYDLGASVDAAPGNDVATWTQSCAIDNGGHPDNRFCTAISETASRGIWSRTYADRPGRRTLLLAEDLPAGATLSLNFDSYTEQPDGSKAVGPTWKSVGITAATLAAAAEDISR